MLTVSASRSAMQTQNHAHLFICKESFVCLRVNVNTCATEGKVGSHKFELSS